MVGLVKELVDLVFQPYSVHVMLCSSLVLWHWMGLFDGIVYLVLKEVRGDIFEEGYF